MARLAFRHTQRSSRGPSRQTRTEVSVWPPSPPPAPTPRSGARPRPRCTSARMRTLPGGTDSNFRAWGDDTIYVDRGKGGYVWDIDGNEYIDLRMGYGPVILGHGDERVDDYVNERMRKGVSFSLTSEDEVQAMELVKELTGWVDKVRMTVSGTEATMHAMRIARAYTGRDRIVKFEGQYHGVHDYALISVAPDDHVRAGRSPTRRSRLAWGRGIPDAVADTIIPARYNNIERAAHAVRGARRGDRGDHRRAGPRQRPGDHAQAGLPPGDARPDRGIRDPADLRRGQDRVPLRQGRRGRVLRGHPGSRDLRQGDGQRLSGRGVRWPRGGHERPARQGQPRRHVRRQPGRRRGRGQDPVDPPRHRRARRRSMPPAGASRPASARSSTRPACRTTSPAIRACSGSCSPTSRRSEYRDWATTDHELYDAIAVGMHARGAMPEPDSREPWFFCEAHAEGDIVDRVVSTLLGLARRGARGARPRRDRRRADVARCHTPAAG